MSRISGGGRLPRPRPRTLQEGQERSGGVQPPLAASGGAPPAEKTPRRVFLGFTHWRKSSPLSRAMLLLRSRSLYLFLYLFVWREKGNHSVLITKRSPSPRRKGGEKGEWLKIKEKTGVVQKASSLDTLNLVQKAFSGEIPAQGFVISPSYLSQPVGRENSSSKSAAQVSTSAHAETQPVPRTFPGDEFHGIKKHAAERKNRGRSPAQIPRNAARTAIT